MYIALRSKQSYLSVVLHRFIVKLVIFPYEGNARDISESHPVCNTHPSLDKTECEKKKEKKGLK